MIGRIIRRLARDMDRLRAYPMATDEQFPGLAEFPKRVRRLSIDLTFKEIAGWLSPNERRALYAIGYWQDGPFLAINQACRYNRLASFPIRFASGIFGAALACAFVACIPIHAINGMASLPIAVIAGAASYLCIIRWFNLLDIRDVQILKRATRQAPAPLGSFAESAVTFMHK